MKITELNLKNFAGYTNVSVSFDDKVTYLIGPNGGGKTTLGVTGIQFIFEGIAEKNRSNASVLIGERFRFIGDNGKSATGEMKLFDEKLGAEIKVARKITKDANFLTFEGPEGMTLDQDWLTSLFNVFLINPMSFAELSPKEQAMQLGIDTDAFDKRISDAKKMQTEKNAVYLSINLPEEAPEKAEPVDVAALIRERDFITEQNRANAHDYEREAEDMIRQATAHNAEVDRVANRIIEIEALIKSLQEEHAILKKSGPLHKIAVPVIAPFVPQSTAELDEKLNKASETNQKAMEYSSYLEAKKRKEAAKNELDAAKSTTQAIEAERLAYIQGVQLPFSEMEIDENGGLLVKGRPLKEPFFSTGELLRMIPSIHAARNPELKYVYLQNFNLLDRENQAKVEDALIKKGFQLVIEYVGEDRLVGKNCIVLRECQVVNEDTQKERLLF